MCRSSAAGERMMRPAPSIAIVSARAALTNRDRIYQSFRLDNKILMCLGGRI